MNPAHFRMIHQYGAILSIGASVGAILAIVIGGPLEPLIFPLGFFGPLSAFYFVGAVLEDNLQYHIFGEELLRGVVWYGGCLLAWAFIITESSRIPATPATVLGLPAVTALGLTLVMVAVRHLSGLDLKIQTEGGQLLVAITGAIVGGFLVIYLIVVQGRSAMIGVVYILATGGGFVFWDRFWRRTS